MADIARWDKKHYTVDAYASQPPNYGSGADLRGQGLYLNGPEPGSEKHPLAIGMGGATDQRMRGARRVVGRPAEKDEVTRGRPISD